MADVDLGKVVGDPGPQGEAGPQGNPGPKGDTGLTLNKIITSAHEIEDTENFLFSDFNRDPVLGEFFTAVCSADSTVNMWEITAVNSQSSSCTATLMSFYSNKGARGESGATAINDSIKDLSHTWSSSKVDNELTSLVESLQSQIDSLQSSLNSLRSLVPNQASSQNQLADKNFVNSSISTNTANYIYKTSGGEKVPFNSVAELEAYSGTVTPNDYAFVTGVDTSGNVYFDRYKANEEAGVITWAKEYRLNNSSFTAQQWAAINSGISDSLVESMATIDDTTPVSDKVFSSEKVDSVYAKKEDIPTKTSDLQNDSDFKPLIELTQAEYDALTEEEKMADVIYMIKDDTETIADILIDDTITSESKTFSSQKIDTDYEKKSVVISPRILITDLKSVTSGTAYKIADFTATTAGNYIFNFCHYNRNISSSQMQCYVNNVFQKGENCMTNGYFVFTALVHLNSGDTIDFRVAPLETKSSTDSIWLIQNGRIDAIKIG